MNIDPNFKVSGTCTCKVVITNTYTISCSYKDNLITLVNPYEFPISFTTKFIINGCVYKPDKLIGSGYYFFDISIFYNNAYIESYT